uniref:V-type proton ATPase subunit a n=1 Tax=Calcidiscus leptoporus TaxID=127549 RepID=A0A7S0P583_9EUKA|mmetsp:Transcript_6289/g.14516  ORF Transcript_6289/g.14516 Transcript_6289/m.14516 type:complete len:840 (+) Transcript_6289:276-2795(+)
MGTMFRSERMRLVQIIDRNDAARDVVRVLGELGVMQLNDLNQGVHFQKRTFSDEARRTQELARVVDFLETTAIAAGLPLAPRDADAPALVNLGELEAQLGALATDVKQAAAHEMQVLAAHNGVKEHLAVLQLGGAVYAAAPTVPADATSAPTSELGIEIASSSHLGTELGASLIENGYAPAASSSQDAMLQLVAGTVPRATALSFEKIAHRMARGNCVVHSLPVEEPLLSAEPKDAALVPKNVVVVFFSGAVLKAKLLKIAPYYGVSVYELPESNALRAALGLRLEFERREVAEVLHLTQAHKRYLLEAISHRACYWRHMCARELSTLHTLNLLSFDLKQRVVFEAEGWVPESRVADVRSALSAAAVTAGRATAPIINILETHETPPTHLPTNKFTAGFQGLVNTYGFPRYREVNPGAFAIICFPFLFGIMFGDVGHGALLLLLALYLIRNEQTLGKQQLDDILAMVYGGRYVLLLNGAFATYVGLIYNEAFAVPLGLFGSSYYLPTNSSEYAWDGSVVAFGIDPTWQLASNKMTFFNSFKMKVAIIFGVAQMTLGISLSLLNHLEFGDVRSIWFQFVPELVFFLAIFGYLVLMILLKWSTDWVGLALRPPSLLNTLIAMFMSPGVYEEEDRLFDGQEYLQLFLLVAALIAVPMLLVPKPLLAYLDLRRRQQYATLPPALEGADAGLQLPPEALEAAVQERDADEEEEAHEEDLSEVVVHQVIHTIEFVLGSISNTASYLRLWALSLAHSQLSELFWEKVMKGVALNSTLPWYLSGGVTFCAFAVWTVLHIGVLMVMENLSSFLHALRLQWVEFQNKFYHGDGKPFMPFSYATVGDDDD